MRPFPTGPDVHFSFGEHGGVVGCSACLASFGHGPIVGSDRPQRLYVSFKVRDNMTTRGRSGVHGSVTFLQRDVNRI